MRFSIAKIDYFAASFLALSLAMWRSAQPSISFCSARSSAREPADTSRAMHDLAKKCAFRRFAHYCNA